MLIEFGFKRDEFGAARHVNTFPSVFTPALSNDGINIIMYLTNHDTQTWTLTSPDGGDLSFHRDSIANPLETVDHIDIPAGGLVILMFPSVQPVLVSLNAVANPCAWPLHLETRLSALSVFMDRILADTNEEYSNDTRLSLRSNAQIVRGTVRQLRNDFGFPE